MIEWNKVADALRESAAKLKQVQRIGKKGYWEHDLTADRITWSEETGRIFGLASFDGGISQAQLEAMTHPDDRQLQRQALSEALQGGRLLDVEFRIIPSSNSALHTDRARPRCRRATRPICPDRRHRYR